VRGGRHHHMFPQNPLFSCPSPAIDNSRESIAEDKPSGRNSR